VAPLVRAERTLPCHRLPVEREALPCFLAPLLRQGRSTAARQLAQPLQPVSTSSIHERLVTVVLDRARSFEVVEQDRLDVEREVDVFADDDAAAGDLVLP
jgi:hypothetical protein